MLGTVEPSALLSVINNSPLMEKYADAVNRESAHEQILAMTEAKEAELIKKQSRPRRKNRQKKKLRQPQNGREAQKEAAKTAQKLVSQPVAKQTL